MKAILDIGQVRGWLQMEGALVAALTMWLYAHTGWDWWIVAALFLLPDLAMLGYLAGPRIGAWSYNALHSYLGPLLLAFGGPERVWPLALIWAFHIGVDRAIGYGLKYPGGFRKTHLSFE